MQQGTVSVESTMHLVCEFYQKLIKKEGEIGFERKLSLFYFNFQNDNMVK